MMDENDGNGEREMETLIADTAGVGSELLEYEM